EPDVLSRGQVTDEATGQLDQRRDSGVDLNRALVRDQHAGDDLEQRALALTVGSDQADGLPGADLEADVPQRPERASRRRGLALEQHLAERRYLRLRRNSIPTPSTSI